VGNAGERGKRRRRHLRTLRECPAPQSHAQCPPSLALGNVGSKNDSVR
jgi:hypothetical protein